MKQARVFLVPVLGLILLLAAAGCQRLEETVRAMEPEIRGISLEWGEVTPQSTGLTATLRVYNPSPISLPIKKSASAKWGAIAEESTVVDLTAVVRNENPYPLSVPGIVHHVDINGLALASGEVAVGQVIAPGAEAEVNTTVALNTSRMGDWFASHIRNGERSTFTTRDTLVVKPPPEMAGQLRQPGLLVPVWEGTQTFETSILGVR